MKNYLLVDFGSTNTKLTAVDVANKVILGTAKAMTTVEEDIGIGFEKALQSLLSKTGPLSFHKKIACSSAAGGLKMAAIGLVEELTVEAAKRACFGAGAKVELVFSHFLTQHDIDEIIKHKIDIILLAGGTDGGNRESVLANATALGKAHITIPIIYAGNKSCQDDIHEIFDEYHLNGTIVENVMPKLNQLKIEEAQDVIRSLFLKNIIAAKGIKQIESVIDEVIFPTPHAVLKAATLLSKGTMHEAGWGDLVLLDIGGATTDVYSMATGAPSRGDVVLKGLDEPFAKRTVEGDLGMRYSAIGIAESLSQESRQCYLEDGFDLMSEAHYRREHVDFIPNIEKDYQVDCLFAGLCADIAFSRHVGKIDSVYTPLGMMYYQFGKDLTHVNAVIGTGGVVIHDDQPQEILGKVCESPDKPLELRPKNPEFMLDKCYILSAMGLLSIDEPLVALQLMKKNIVRIK
ncbi:MAG: methylaspartate mutase accessory protein GlmL [Bacilli bacterium]|nr:methylaspartate mutase accessory protein GlmL [Bacilli bacterium]